MTIFRFSAVTAALLCAGVAAAQNIAVPSGTDMTLYDVRLETAPQMARFRFVAPAIDPAGEGKTFADLVDDFDYICAQVIVPSLAANGWDAGDVVLSVSNVETEFGAIVPEITQFFQPYTVADGACIWKEF